MHVAAARPENLYRSAYHALSAVTTLWLLEEVFDRRMAIAAALAFAIFAWTLEVTRRRIPAWNGFLMKHLGIIAHRHERSAVNSGTWFGTGLAIIAPLFAVPTCALALATIGLGDPAAGFVGRRFGKVKLVNGRSLEGTITYALVSFIAGLAVMGLWHREIAADRAVLAAGVAAVAGALTELFCRRVDDNFAVPVVVSVAVGLVIQGG
jgi:dolichol kinase